MDVNLPRPYLIDSCPFSDEHTSIEVEGQTARIPPLQLVVWVALAPAGQIELLDNPRWMPAIIDTGCTDNLVISERHLCDWAGLDPLELKCVGFDGGISASGHRTLLLPRLEANLWLYCATGATPLGPCGPEAPAAPAAKLELDRGFLLFDAAQPTPGPYLPLLGATALHRAGLQLEVDYHALRFSLRQTASRDGSG